MKVENILLIEYITGDSILIEKYNFIMKFAEEFKKSANYFNIQELRLFRFSLIKDLQYDLNKGFDWNKLIGYICMFTNKKKGEILNTRILYICQFKNYLIREIELINKIEAIELGYEKTDIDEAAGIDRFNIFGYYPQLRELANGDITKIESIEKMKYNDCFVELSYRKRQFDFERARNKLLEKKHGTF